MPLTSFLLDWSFAPSVVVGLALVVALYALGLRDIARRGRFGHTVAWRHVVSFTLGVLAVFVALTSPLDTLDERLFTLHMAQHMLLLMVAPPLLLLGKPVSVLLVGPPRAVVRGLTRAYRRANWPQRLTRVLTAPLVAWLLYNGGLLLWHAPALYEITLRYEGAHLLEHLYSLGSGLLFWWVVIEPLPGPTRLHPGLRLVYLWTAAIPNGLLGMAFATKDTLVYNFYGHQPPLWGIAPIDDQHLAGLVMALPGDAIELIVGAALFMAMMTPDADTLVADAENIAQQAGALWRGRQT